MILTCDCDGACFIIRMRFGNNRKLGETDLYMTKKGCKRAAQRIAALLGAKIRYTKAFLTAR